MELYACRCAHASAVGSLRGLKRVFWLVESLRFPCSSAHSRNRCIRTRSRHIKSQNFRKSRSAALFPKNVSNRQRRYGLFHGAKRCPFVVVHMYFSAYMFMQWNYGRDCFDFCRRITNTLEGCVAEYSSISCSGVWRPGQRTHRRSSLPRLQSSAVRRRRSTRQPALRLHTSIPYLFRMLSIQYVRRQS